MSREKRMIPEASDSSQRASAQIKTENDLSFQAMKDPAKESQPAPEGKEEEDTTKPSFPLSNLHAFLSLYSLLSSLPQKRPHMERQQYGFTLPFSLVTLLGLVSFALCIAAEFKRSKREDLRLDGQLCYLPQSDAFGYGIAALILLFIAQVSGNFVVCRKFCPGEQSSSCKAKKVTVSSIFLILSWISFGIAVILIGAATSMSQTQHFGEGWLDGECYIIKDGVYTGSGILILITVSSTLTLGILTIRKGTVDQG